MDFLLPQLVDLVSTVTLLADGSSTQEWIEWLADYSYIGVFLFLLACGFGFPMPEEIALVAGGYAVYQAGQLDPSRGDLDNAILMVIVSLMGVLIGDCTIYSAGRKAGQHPERLPGVGSHLTPKRMMKARALFQRYGPKMVFFGRFLFGIRPVIFFVAGTLRLPFKTFIGWNGTAAIISVPACVLLSWYYGSELERAIVFLGGFERVMAVIGGVGITVMCVVIWKKRHTFVFPSTDDLDPVDAPEPLPKSENESTDEPEEQATA